MFFDDSINPFKDTLHPVFPEPMDKPVLVEVRFRGEARTKARDSQRTKVYKWEFSYFGSQQNRTELTPTESLDLIQQIFNDHGIPVPHTRFVNNARTSHWRIGHYSRLKDAIIPAELKLAKWGRNRITICHEVAHALNSYADPDRAAHGAEWVRIYTDLLGRYTDHDSALLRISVQDHNIDIA